MPSTRSPALVIDRSSDHPGCAIGELKGVGDEPDEWRDGIVRIALRIADVLLSQEVLARDGDVFPARVGDSPTTISSCAARNFSGESLIAPFAPTVMCGNRSEPNRGGLGFQVHSLGRHGASAVRRPFRAPCRVTELCDERPSILEGRDSLKRCRLSANWGDEALELGVIGQ